MINERRKRPFGVYAIIVLFVIDSLTTVLYLVAWYFFVDQLPELAAPMADPVFWFDLGQALLEVVTIVGLLRLRRWAWYCSMLLVGSDLLLGIWQYFQGQQPYVDLFLNALIVFYLNQRDVQGAFGEGKAPTP